MTIPDNVKIDYTETGYQITLDGAVIKEVGFKDFVDIEKMVPGGISPEARKRMLRELADRVRAGLAAPATNRQRAELWLSDFLARPQAGQEDPQGTRAVHSELHEPAG